MKKPCSVSLKSLEGKKRNKKILEKRADEVLSNLETSVGKPLKEMNGKFLEGLVRGTTQLLYIEKGHFKAAMDIAEEAIKIIEQRTQAHRKGVDSRPDQIDKLNFQKGLMSNIDDYPTKSAAIRDFQLKPQFENYSHHTLRSWTDEVWNKPTKVGRPRKLPN